MKKTKFLHEMICEATGIPAKLAPTIERMMREDIFHGSLDGHPPEELEKGACEAYALYKRAPSYFATATSWQAASRKRKRADKKLAIARKRGKPEAIAKAEEHLNLCACQEEQFGGLCAHLCEKFSGARV